MSSDKDGTMHIALKIVVNTKFRSNNFLSKIMKKVKLMLWPLNLFALDFLVHYSKLVNSGKNG